MTTTRVQSKSDALLRQGPYGGLLTDPNVQIAYDNVNQQLILKDLNNGEKRNFISAPVRDPPTYNYSTLSTAKPPTSWRRAIDATGSGSTFAWPLHVGTGSLGTKSANPAYLFTRTTAPNFNGVKTVRMEIPDATILDTGVIVNMSGGAYNVGFTTPTNSATVLIVLGAFGNIQGNKRFVSFSGTNDYDATGLIVAVNDGSGNVDAGLNGPYSPFRLISDMQTPKVLVVRFNKSAGTVGEWIFRIYDSSPVGGTTHFSAVAPPGGANLLNSVNIAKVRLARATDSTGIGDNMDVGDVLFYNSALSDGDLADLTTVLLTNYGQRSLDNPIYVAPTLNNLKDLNDVGFKLPLTNGENIEYSSTAGKWVNVPNSTLFPRYNMTPAESVVASQVKPNFISTFKATGVNQGSITLGEFFIMYISIFDSKGNDRTNYYTSKLAIGKWITLQSGNFHKICLKITAVALPALPASPWFRIEIDKINYEVEYGSLTTLDVSKQYDLYFCNTQDLCDVEGGVPSVGQLLIASSLGKYSPQSMISYFAHWDDNTTLSSGGGLDQVNWMQGTYVTTVNAPGTGVFSLGANNAIAYNGTPSITVEVAFSGTPFAGSNDRTIHVTAYKNPSAILNPLISGLIPGSRGVSILRTNIDDTDMVSGFFTTTLSTGDFIRFYVSNVDNADAITMQDWRIKIKSIIV